jgi:hypothetical protein
METTFHLLERDERVVGAMVTQGLPAWILGERATVGRGGDLMVDPMYRRRGIARAVAVSALISLRAHPCVVHFPAEVTFLVCEAPGTTIKRGGRMPQWVRWERPGALRADRPTVPLVLAAIATASFRAACRASSIVSRDVRCREITLAEFDSVVDEFDRLAIDSREIAPCVMVRDAAYVRWRWLDRPDPWRVVVAHQSRGGAEAMRGYVAYRMLDGDCRIGDIMCFEPRTMRALLSAVRARTAAERPGRTLIDLNDPRPWTRRVLRQAGFLRRGLGPNVTVCAVQEDLPVHLEDLSSWYLTAGDADLV